MPMSIQRWDPWRDIVSLREAMNSLLEESFVRPRPGTSQVAGMPIDLRETDSGYVVEATLPGAKPEDVEISVLGDTLRISAQVHDTSEQSGEKWLVRERRFGRFERALTLPMQVKSDAATADFRDGVLSISLPKAEVARPRSIQVRPSTSASVGSGQQSGQPIEVETDRQLSEQSQPAEQTQQS
jgi:HSP20 family protein